MTVHLSLSQEQYATLLAALDESIDNARTAAAEALRKHNLTRHRRRKEAAAEYAEIRDILDIQYSHPGV